MRFAHLSVVAIPLAALGLWFAPTVPAIDDDAPWLQVNTQGKNAVVLEFASGGEHVSTALVREGEIGSIRFGDETESIGFVPEWIAERGEQVRLKVYRVEDQYAGTLPRAKDWIEDVELSKGSSPFNPPAVAAWTGQPTFTVRLVDTIIATR